MYCRYTVCPGVISTALKLTAKNFVEQMVHSQWSMVNGQLEKPKTISTPDKKFLGVQNPFFKKGFGRRRLYRTGDLARWLSDGNIEFLGRMDNQVKIRGFRIELGEIETQLSKHPRIKEAVVKARTGGDGSESLCAYMVAADGGEDIPGISEIRQYLSRTLPDYMIPSYVMQLETIPLTPNGKVNRKALPQPTATSVEAYAAPSNQVEEQLVEIWSQLLDVKTIGVNDNFFDLGGNSARLIRLADILNKRFPVEVKIVDLFHFNTIGQLAEHLPGSTDLDINTAADIDGEEIESFSL